MKKNCAEELVVHSLVWHNPHREPPQGMPRILAEETIPRNQQSVVVDRLWYPGCGYSCVWRPLFVGPVRRLSLETKQRIRRNNLAKRMQAKVPMFAAEMIAKKMSRDPEYFGQSPQ